MKVLLFDAIKAAQVALGLVPKVLDAIDVVPVLGKARGVVDSPVMKLTNIECILGPERVGVNDAIGTHLLLNNWQQGLGPGIRDNGRTHLATPL